MQQFVLDRVDLVTLRESSVALPPHDLRLPVDGVAVFSLGVYKVSYRGKGATLSNCLVL